MLNALVLALACHAAVGGDASRVPTAQAPVVQTQAFEAPALRALGPLVDCPDCVGEDDGRLDEPARGDEPTEAHAVPVAANTAVDVAECTAHHPCQHEAAEKYPSQDPVVRAQDGPRDSARAAQLSWHEAADPAPLTPGPPSASHRVPAAVVAPVAVLCVDRN